MASESLHVTENHPFYVRRKHNLQERKKIQRIKQRLLLERTNQQSKFKWSDGRKDRHSNILKDKFENNDFWYLIGRYIGDGWIRSGGGVIVCANGF